MEVTIRIILGIATLLMVLGMWEYLSIRRSLDMSDNAKLKQIRVAWRLLGLFLAFMLLAQLLTLLIRFKQIIEIPDFFQYAVLVVGALFVSVSMLVFRVTLACALKGISPERDISAMGDGVWCDPLTGLPNRRALANTLKQEWHRSERHKRPLAVLMIDLDNFGRIIDESGYDGADEYLKAFAKFMVGQLRVADTVTRYDSDIFIVILPEEGPSTARFVAERLRKNIADFRVDVKGRKISVTASIGVTNNTIGEFESSDELLKRADHACTAARNGGHNRVVSYSLSGM